MRIISGQFGGRKLKMVPSDSTKETSDKVRGAVFNSLSNEIRNTVVLDLFSGSGSFGFEALSRGAKNVILVDLNKDAIKTIKANAMLLDVLKNTRIIQTDYLKALKLFKEEGQIFDVIFLDPPYEKDYYINALVALEDLTNEDSIIICEMHKNNQMPDEIGVFECLKEKIYGIKKIRYYYKKAL